MRNIHNPVKDRPHLIANYLQENVTRIAQPVTQHDYMNKMANAVIEEDTEVSIEYRQLIKTQISDRLDQILRQ